MAVSNVAFSADKLVVGFSQIGAESGWRSAETKVTYQEADKRGVELKFSDAQQKQENQIKAIRAFVAQEVDAIFLAPVVETGWTTVLKEAKEAGIPVFLLDRLIEDKDVDLYTSAIVSDQVLEGRLAAEWLAEATGGKANIVELQGTVGASVTNNRKKGFEEVVAQHPDMKIIHSQSGDFTRSKGKEVMESFIKAENGGKNITAMYAHNDDMAIGAIQAIKEAGLIPGKDILVVSIDGVPDIFKAMADGEANATVELTPNMAGPALDALIKFKADGVAPPKVIQTETKVYLPDTAQAEYDRRKELY
ncbi:MAG: ABC transporter substrate-binding protein [Deltaproteobacteria bacterium]|nr:ABC transporter substrate-binding protein [Deltaproteobacteria bacterium]